MLFPIWFRIVLYINKLFVISEKHNSSFNYLLLQSSLSSFVSLCPRFESQ